MIKSLIKKLLNKDISNDIYTINYCIEYDDGFAGGVERYSIIIPGESDTRHEYIELCNRHDIVWVEMYIAGKRYYFKK